MNWYILMSTNRQPLIFQAKDDAEAEGWKRDYYSDARDAELYRLHPVRPAIL